MTRSCGALLLLGVAVSPSYSQGVAVNRTTAETVQKDRSTNVLQLPARLSVHGEPLANALAQLKRSSGVRLAFSPTLLPVEHRVSCDCAEVSVGVALERMLAGTKLTFASNGRHVLIRPVLAAWLEGNASPASTLVFNRVVPPFKPALTAAGTINGQVTGPQGEPLASANVAVVGTQMNALTGANGRYTISGIPAGAYQLRASVIGYSEQTVEAVPVEDEQTTTIDFRLQPQAIQLDQILAIGYGTAERRDVTGSVGSVDVNQGRTGVTPSVAQVLAGRVAGVQVTQTSGEPGGGMSIRIRGTSSINAGNEPLYVVDGLPIDNSSTDFDVPRYDNRPRNPLNSLSPEDIASIEILKDASATAIYGSRGANGVVLITTKNGSLGALTIDYEGSVGHQSVTRKMDVLSAQEYVALMNDLRRDMGEPPEFSSEEIAAIGTGTDWQDEIFRGSTVSNHHLAFSGGGDNSRFYASLGVYDQQGVAISSGIKRYTARTNVDFTGSRLRLGLNLNASYIEDDFVPLGTGVNESSGVVAAGIYQDPTLDTEIIDGHYPISSFVNIENPLAIAHGVEDFGRTNRLFGSAFAEYSLGQGLTAKLNVGADRQTSRREFYKNTLSKDGMENSGIAQVGSDERSSNLVEVTANYSRDLGGSQRIELLGGLTYQTFSQTSLSAAAEGFSSDAFRFDNLGAGNQSTYDVSTGRARNQLLSYLGRVNYSIADKYLLTGAFRVDGSSRFGEETKFGYFPSGAFAWRLIDEPFMQAQSIFDDLKLRLSYGVTGNQEIGNYNSLVLLGTQGTAYLDDVAHVGIGPEQIANPDLRWETTAQFNAGLDFALAGGRVAGSIEYYTKNTSNLLLDLPIPGTTGFTSMLRNVGKVHNHGWELSLNTDNLTGDFGWRTSLNLSAVRNEVTDLAGLPHILQGSLQFVEDFSILRVGDPMNSYYGYIVDGVFQLDDDIASSPQPEAKPGELKYRDINGDGEITTDDRTILGTPFPDFTFGLNNSFSYGPFELNVFFQGSVGNDLLNVNTIEAENPVSFRRNRLEEAYTDRWTPDNPTNENPSWLPVDVVYGGPVNSRAVEDASYLRLKNLELRYHVPTNSRLNFLRSATIYVSGQNLWTLTGYSGFDPEVSSFGDSNVIVDYGAYPVARTIMAGVRVGL